MRLLPTDPFVPLTASKSPSDDKAEYRARVVSEPGETKFFKPLTTEPSSTEPEVHVKKTCDPRISIQREGDQVSSIRIHCGCGQIIDLACIY